MRAPSLISHSLILHSLILTAAIVILAGSTAWAGSEQEYVPKVEAKSLYQSALPAIEGKEMIVKHFTLPAGYDGDRHQHPGPVFVYVLKGELTVETDDGTQTFAAGELYPEPLNVVMRGRNTSTSEATEILVFQVGDIGKPMMIKAE